MWIGLKFHCHEKNVMTFTIIMKEIDNKKILSIHKEPFNQPTHNYSISHEISIVARLVQDHFPLCKK